MHRQEVRRRVSAKLKEIKHRPPAQGGNGRGLTEPQRLLSQKLGPDWITEFVVPTRIPRGEGYPTHYKIDLANPAQMIAIEVDGGSHCSLKVRERDARKAEFLRSKGWSVFRVSNARALALCSTSQSAGTLLTLLKGS